MTKTQFFHQKELYISFFSKNWVVLSFLPLQLLRYPSHTRLLSPVTNAEHSFFHFLKSTQTFIENSSLQLGYLLSRFPKKEENLDIALSWILESIYWVNELLFLYLLFAFISPFLLPNINGSQEEILIVRGEFVAQTEVQVESVVCSVLVIYNVSCCQESPRSLENLRE